MPSNGGIEATVFGMIGIFSSLRNQRSMTIRAGGTTPFSHHHTHVRNAESRSASSYILFVSAVFCASIRISAAAAAAPALALGPPSTTGDMGSPTLANVRWTGDGVGEDAEATAADGLLKVM